MALNTNGWDYIYTTTINKLNDIIKGKNNTSEYKNLIHSSITGQDSNSNPFTLNVILINEFKIIDTSDYNVINIHLDLKTQILLKEDNVIIYKALF